MLSDKERNQLKAQHKQERDGRVRDRIKAVLLHDKRWSPQQIAEALLISDQAVRNHLSEYEAICFTDGVHPTHNVQPAFGWIKKGIRKELPANTGRARLNLSGSIDVINHRLVIHEDYTLNAESTMRFFRKIEEAYPEKRKVHVFCDNASYYRNAKVKEYLQNSKIELHFLPPYSPNLNPIERLWKWMKERVVYNTYYEHFEDFKAAIFGFFSALANAGADSELSKVLRSRVRDKFSPIQAPVTSF